MRARFGLSLIVVGCGLMGGCVRPFETGSTPAYTADERGKMIARNWDYEGKQASDDMDDLLMLRPASRMTPWNVR